MIRLVISGCNGCTGSAVARSAEDDPEITVAAGVDINTQKMGGFPVFAEISEFAGDCDVIVDFSTPEALDGLLKYGASKGIPLVLCTTGYDKPQIESIGRAAERIPVFKSGNMSLGINLLAELVRRTCKVLGGAFDIEIVERHHRRKVDAPSGTALMLAEAAASGLPYEPSHVYCRGDKRKPREGNEIGISSVRGGTIVGVHEVVFAGRDEVLELKHSVASSEVFAVGAIRAVKFIAGMEKPGLYDMGDVIRDSEFV